MCLVTFCLFALKLLQNLIYYKCLKFAHSTEKQIISLFCSTNDDKGKRFSFLPSRSFSCLSPFLLVFTI